MSPIVFTSAKTLNRTTTTFARALFNTTLSHCRVVARVFLPRQRLQSHYPRCQPKLLMRSKARLLSCDSSLMSDPSPLCFLPDRPDLVATAYPNPDISPKLSLRCTPTRRSPMILLLSQHTLAGALPTSWLF